MFECLGRHHVVPLVKRPYAPRTHVHSSSPVVSSSFQRGEGEGEGERGREREREKEREREDTRRRYNRGHRREESRRGTSKLSQLIARVDTEVSPSSKRE